jgi:hypothetical protein
MTSSSGRRGVDLDAQRHWIEALRRIDAEIARLGEARSRIVAHLQEAMGAAEEGRVDGRRVIRWAWTRPATRLDRRGLEAAHPAIAARFTRRARPARPFLVEDAGEPR